MQMGIEDLPGRRNQQTRGILQQAEVSEGSGGAGGNKCWVCADSMAVAGIQAHTGHSRRCLGIALVTETVKEGLVGTALTSSHAPQAGPARLEASSRPLLSCLRLRGSKKGWKGKAFDFQGFPS